MQLSHTRPVRSAVFDDPSLVSSAGLVPMLALARSAGLTKLADQHLSVPTDKGANPGVEGRLAGGRDGRRRGQHRRHAVLRHGGMGKVFTSAYAPSTLGSFLRSFTFGHVRQLDAVSARFLSGLAATTPLVAGIDDQVMAGIDDTIIEVHGYGKQGSGYGYSGVRGLNAILATLTTKDTAPVIVAQRLRKGSCGSPRGAKRLVTDALATVKKLRTGPGAPKVLLRADSAFYGHGGVGAAVRAGAQVSVTVRLDPTVKAAIAAIPNDAWQTIEYTNAIFDQASQVWISAAEVAEIRFTAFAAQKKANQIPGRLVVRRIPDLNPHTGQATLFETWRFHAFFTTSTLDTVAADKTHRGHAIIEQVHADLKNSALAHLPSGKFTANAAWLVLAVMAFNLTRAAATLAGTSIAKATTGTIRRKLVHVPARIASSARRLTLHLPTAWPWENAWTTLFTGLCAPPPAAVTT